MKETPRCIDTHVHVWRMDDGRDIWFRRKVAALQHDFDERALKQTLLVSGARSAIIVQASADVREILLKLQEGSHPDHVLGYIASVDPLAGDAQSVVEELVRWPRFLGVRLMPADTFGTSWMSDERAARFVARLEERGISVDTVQRQENLEGALRFFSRFPRLRLVLNHCGRPNVQGPPDPAWLDAIGHWSQKTTAVVKCSGVVERAGVEWSVDSIAPFIGHVLRCFGTERVMFGSNWPLVNLAASHAGWREALADLLVRFGYGDSDAEAVFWRTALRHYANAS